MSERQFDFSEAVYGGDPDPGDTALGLGYSRADRGEPRPIAAQPAPPPPLVIGARPPAGALPSRLLAFPVTTERATDLEKALLHAHALIGQTRDERDEAAERAYTAEARVAELEKLLRPLVPVADAMDEWQHADGMRLFVWAAGPKSTGDVSLTAGHARAARAALAGPNIPAGGPNTEQPGPDVPSCPECGADPAFGDSHVDTCSIGAALAGEEGQP